MSKKIYQIVFAVASFLFFQKGISAQEFPIAVGSDTTFSGGAVYGDNNGLVAIYGDSESPYSINAQLIAYPGDLIGPRISLGDTGVFPGAIPIFDGTNYFLMWCDFYGTLKGEFIDTNGNLVGSPITIATDLDPNGRNSIAMGDTVFLAVFVKNDGYLYGQMLSSSGDLIGSQIQISNNYARENATAFDGNNFLVVWVDDNNDKDIYGQFVSKTGSLVGGNFVIDNGPYYSDNPVSLAFDGTRYLLAFHETLSDVGFPKWTLLGRFITTSGTLEDTFTICDTTKMPFLPYVAFDGTNYLITWTQFSDSNMVGRFYNTFGEPIDTPFVIFAPLNNKIPVGGVGFGGGNYLVIATRVNSDLTDGDVYGRFISPVSIRDENSLNIKPKLFPNYPNPFSRYTNIQYELPKSTYVTLRIYNMLGQEVATLVRGVLPAGKHTIRWNSADLPEGIYFCNLETTSSVETKKLILLK
ncbi:MAG: T9SS type A sorting domain-containing protein [bacterium]|nr:T9SS type A sorting domain-containing protein [bacterium]